MPSEVSLWSVSLFGWILKGRYLWNRRSVIFKFDVCVLAVVTRLPSWVFVRLLLENITYSKFRLPRVKIVSVTNSGTKWKSWKHSLQRQLHRLHVSSFLDTPLPLSKKNEGMFRETYSMEMTVIRSVRVCVIYSMIFRTILPKSLNLKN